MQDALTGIKSDERTLLLPDLPQELINRQLNDIDMRMANAEESIRIYDETPHNDEALRQWAEVMTAGMFG